MAGQDETSNWNRTRFSKRVGIEYPIVQGPLGGLSSQRLTATVSNFGGLGSFGAHGLTPGAIKDVIAEFRSLTSFRPGGTGEEFRPQSPVGRAERESVASHRRRDAPSIPRIGGVFDRRKGSEEPYLGRRRTGPAFRNGGPPGGTSFPGSTAAAEYCRRASTS
jgi:hypothetical protein